MKRYLSLGLVALTLSVSGCGTLLSVTCDDQHRWDVFAGVRADAALMRHLPFVALDFPLSLVADLALLPITSARAAAAHFAEGSSPPEQLRSGRVRAYTLSARPMGTESP